MNLLGVYKKTRLLLLEGALTIVSCLAFLFSSLQSEPVLGNSAGNIREGERNAK
jgi:hypothetical protein